VEITDHLDPSLQFLGSVGIQIAIETVPST
jgi:hypothetical protein